MSVNDVGSTPSGASLNDLYFIKKQGTGVNADWSELNTPARVLSGRVSDKLPLHSIESRHNSNSF
jgi:hypothetical protein